MNIAYRMPQCCFLIYNKYSSRDVFYKYTFFAFNRPKALLLFVKLFKLLSEEWYNFHGRSFQHEYRCREHHRLGKTRIMELQAKYGLLHGRVCGSARYDRAAFLSGPDSPQQGANVLPRPLQVGGSKSCSTRVSKLTFQLKLLLKY